MKNMIETLPILAPMEADYVIGSMIWTGYDYLGESMTWPSKGWSGAPLRTNREKKPGYYILQSHWAQKPMVHISVLDGTLADEGVKDHWDMPMYADHWHFPWLRMGVIPYVIATNCDEARLWLNGERYYPPALPASNSRLITGYLPWKPGVLRVEGYREGMLACYHELVTPISPAAKLRFDVDSIAAPAQKGYELLLTVRALDMEDHPCFRESASVRFVVEGEADLLAVDNGNLMHAEPYSSDNVHLFHGVASAQISLRGISGRVRVSAFAEGMQAAHAEVIPK